MSSWLNNSMDPINGNDKKADKYWGDVAKAYNSTTPRNRWRNPKQAKERWHRINRWTDLFQAAWFKAKRMYTSGHSDQDWIDKAHKFYENENQLGHFVLMDVWYACRDQPKWTAYNNDLKRARKRKGGSNEATSEPVEVNELPRPIGQKAAKKAAREMKGKSKDSADVEEIEKLNQIQADFHTSRIKMLEMQEKLSAEKLESSKRTQLAARDNRFAAKDNKEAKMYEKEAKMLETYSRLITQDTTQMADDIRAEHVAAIKCLRKVLFPDLS